MAFEIKDVPAQNNNNSAAADSWKAQGFLNLYLPSKNGGRRKLGAIPLKESRTTERDLLKWLNEDPSRVSKILAKLVIEYQSAEVDEGAAFDLA